MCELSIRNLNGRLPQIFCLFIMCLYDSFIPVKLKSIMVQSLKYVVKFYCRVLSLSGKSRKIILLFFQSGNLRTQSGKSQGILIGLKIKSKSDSVTFWCIIKTTYPYLGKDMWNWKWVEVIMEFWDFIREKSRNFVFLKCWEPCIVSI